MLFKLLCFEKETDRKISTKTKTDIIFCNLKDQFNALASEASWEVENKLNGKQTCTCLWCQLCPDKLNIMNFKIFWKPGH